MLAKLPYYIQNKWRDYRKQWRELYGEDSYPPFSNFVDFIKDCADKANIPELAELSKFKETSRQGKRINLDRAGVSAYTAIRSEEKNSDGIPKQRSWRIQRPAYFAEEIMILVLARRLLENLSKRERISFSRTIYIYLTVILRSRVVYELIADEVRSIA